MSQVSSPCSESQSNVVQRLAMWFDTANEHNVLNCVQISLVPAVGKHQVTVPASH